MGADLPKLLSAAVLTSTSWKDAGAFIASLWKIGRLMENWKRLCEFLSAPTSL